jgi:IS30 family transposase
MVNAVMIMTEEGVDLWTPVTEGDVEQTKRLLRAYLGKETSFATPQKESG